MCNAALEVYVRRAYTSYDISTLQHLELSGEVPIVYFQFMLPPSHPSRLSKLDEIKEGPQGEEGDVRKVVDSFYRTGK